MSKRAVVCLMLLAGLLAADALVGSLAAQADLPRPRFELRPPSAPPPPRAAAPQQTTKQKDDAAAKELRQDKIFAELSRRTLMIGVDPFRPVAPPVGAPRSDDLKNPDNFPATFFTDVGVLICTWTLIGPRVVLTAAHCTGGVSALSIDLPVPFNEDGTPLSGEEIENSSRDPNLWPIKRVLGSCRGHPAYAGRMPWQLYDWALCRLDEDFPQQWIAEREKKGRVLDVVYERLSLDPADIKLRLPSLSGIQLALAGFGCQVAGGKAGDWGAGYARVSNLGPVRVITGSPFRNDSAVICSGDSGGAAYRFRNDRADQFGRRVIVAVNSHNLINYRQSFLARTSSPAFVRFFREWRAANGNPLVCEQDMSIESRCTPGKRKVRAD